MGYSPAVEQSKIRYFHAVNTLTQLEFLGIHFWTPLGGLTPLGPTQGPMDPAGLEERISFWLRDDQLTLFILIFLKLHLPKIFGGALITPHYWYFWKPAPHLCKESGAPTMLGVFSLPFVNRSNPLFISLFQNVPSS